MDKMLCEICGSEFTPEEIGKNHYIVRDNVKSVLAAALSPTEEFKLYDAFDCPVCKCQNIIGERKRCSNVIDVEELLEDENEEDDCKYSEKCEEGYCSKLQKEECKNKLKENEEVDPISGETYGKPPKNANPVI